MRTKALLLTAAFGAAGLATSMAQSTPVYSVNAVGYVNVSLNPGFNMLANPLNSGDNSLSTILPSAPDGTVVYKFDPGTGFENANTFFAGVGWLPDNTLSPGEGAFVYNPTSDAVTVTFVGEVPQGDLKNPVPAGFSIKSSQVPQEATLTDLGFPAGDGDTVYQFDSATQAYKDAVTYFAGVGWLPSEPSPKVGEAFWVLKGTAADWNRTFSVN
jgi:hypothetical protein